MKTEIRKFIKVKLELEYDEALWLRQLVQNPIPKGDILTQEQLEETRDVESNEENAIRRKYWEALKDIGR